MYKEKKGRGGGKGEGKGMNGLMGNDNKIK